MNVTQKFSLILSCCFLPTTFSLSACSEKPLIISVKTAEKTYYSYNVYSAKKQRVYYNDSIELDLDLLPCEQIVRTATKDAENSFSITISPYQYINESDRIKYDIQQKSSLNIDDEYDEYSESEMTDDWLAFEQGFIRQQSLLDQNFYYTYSNTLRAQLYMSVNYKLSEQKAISLKEKTNTYQMTYYIYNSSTLSFDKQVIEIPINQITLITYA